MAWAVAGRGRLVVQVHLCFGGWEYPSFWWLHSDPIRVRGGCAGRGEGTGEGGSTLLNLHQALVSSRAAVWSGPTLPAVGVLLQAPG